MHVFSMNDCDWVAAETAEDAIKFYLDMISVKDTPEDRAEYLEEPIEALPQEAMDRLRFYDPDNDIRCSFTEQLAKELARGQTFPAFFASTEY